MQNVKKSGGPGCGCVVGVWKRRYTTAHRPHSVWPAGGPGKGRRPCGREATGREEGGVLWHVKRCGGL
jgi:hypothetical protein